MRLGVPTTINLQVCRNITQKWLPAFRGLTDDDCKRLCSGGRL